jgi:hypothetical protein
MLRQRIAFFGLIALSSCGGDEASKREPSGGEHDAQVDSNRDASQRNPDASDAESKSDASSTERQPDTSAADGGRADAGSTDAGRTDAGARDAGPAPEDCPTIELDYAGFADGFFAMNCRSCHSASRSGDARMGAPANLNYDSEAEISSARDRIRQAAVVDKRMPPRKKLSDCSIERLASYLDQLTVPVCTPDCSNKHCGDDGCTGSCGTCAEGSSCNGQGICSCVPSCQGKSCGADGCGGSCGTCGAGTSCDAQGSCVCAPDCQNKQCGSDGCGGQCGSCSIGATCSAQGSCVCVPNCQGKQCGDDGCSGSCGSCGAGLSCNAQTSQCQASCTPNCTGRACGSDGCAGSCGTCGPSLACDAAGQCQCTPSCTGRQCGGDGCSGTCGTCTTGQTCSAAGTCSAPAIDFATDVYPIFAAANCGNSNCHGGSAPARGMNLSSASLALANLVGVPADECGERLRVAPGAPASSYLINKLTGVDLCSGERMPRGGAALPATQIDTVRAWITSLAP